MGSENIKARILFKNRRIGLIFLFNSTILNDTFKTIPLNTMGEQLDIRLIEQILSETLPLINKKEIEPYDNLLEDLNKFGVYYANELYFLIEKHKEIILQVDQDKAEEIKNELLYMDFEVFKTTLQRINKGIFYGHVGLVREALNFEFGETWSKYSTDKSFVNN
jgi:hypothetical protein